MTWHNFLSSALTKLTCCFLFWIYQQVGNHNYHQWITAHSRENRSSQHQVWPFSLQNSFCSAGKAGKAKAAREAGIVTYCKTDKADWRIAQLYLHKNINEFCGPFCAGWTDNTTPWKGALTSSNWGCRQRNSSSWVCKTMAHSKKNPVRRLVHSPQKVLMRSCAHETPPLLQAPKNPRCVVNSLLERSVFTTASFTHLPHHAVDKEVTHCQEGITLSPTQEEVLQGFHNLQGSRKVSLVEQPGGTSYQHYTPYPLSQAQEVLKETRLSTNWNKRVFLCCYTFQRQNPRRTKQLSSTRITCGLSRSRSQPLWYKRKGKWPCDLHQLPAQQG